MSNKPNLRRFFSPLYICLALILSLVASVSSYFKVHQTIAGFGGEELLHSILRAAAAYILLVLADLLLDYLRPFLTTGSEKSNRPANKAARPADKNDKASDSLRSGKTGSLLNATSGISHTGKTGRFPDTASITALVFDGEKPAAPAEAKKPAPPVKKAVVRKKVFPTSTSVKRNFLLFFLISLLLGLPAFLALFPGYTAYDTPMQMEQFFTRGVLNSTQPVPLTLLFAACLRLGVTVFHSANAGLLLHTLLQYFFNAACLALVGCILVRWGIKRWFALLLLVLLELLPFVQIFVFTTAKDGFFSPLFALWLALTANIFLHLRRSVPKTVPLIAYGILSLLMILIRPQGKYIFLAAAILLLISSLLQLRKKGSAQDSPSASASKQKASANASAAASSTFASQQKSPANASGAFAAQQMSPANAPADASSSPKKSSRKPSISAPLSFALLAAAVLLISSLITGPLYRAAGVYPASPSEMLSLPIQQMTRVVALHEAELTPTELGTYDTYLDRTKIPTNYIPQISDLMKMSPVFYKESYQKNKGGFFGLWITLFKKYPLEYVDAFLYLTDGYFCQSLGYSHAWAGLADEFIPGPAEYATHAVSLLPAYRTFLLETVGKQFATMYPILGHLCTISLPFWTFALLGSLALRKKKRTAIAILFLLVLYFGTLLLGPVCTVRYTIPLLYAILVFVALLLAEPE